MKTVLSAPVPTQGASSQGLDRELQYGPGLRVQRLVEAACLVAALYTQDVRFAYLTFALTVLEALSPRWVPVARAVARVVRFRGEHRFGDLYFDLRGSRGACAISVVVQALGIGAVWAGHPTLGFIVLAVPAASFLMAPTLGFCAGCWFYVLGRDWAVRHGLLEGGFDDHADIDIDEEVRADQRQLRPPPQR